MNKIQRIKKVFIPVFQAFFVVVLFLEGCGTKGRSSSPFHIYSSVDTSLVTVGDVIHFQVWARGAGERNIEFPQLKLDNPNISVGTRKELEGEYQDDYGVEFEISFWDTGSFELPAYETLILTTSGDTIDYTITTDPIQVQVQSVIRDPQPKLREIKPSVPIPTVIPVKIIVNVLLLIVLIGLLIWLWKKRIPYVPEKEDIIIPSRPPYDIAIEKLNRLKKFDFGTRDAIKSYYATLSFIVREYLENQYFIRFIEMTTEEIELAEKVIPVENQLISELLEVLKRADLAKFARFRPDRNQCKSDLRTIENFINATKIDWIVRPIKEEPLEVLND